MRHASFVLWAVLVSGLGSANQALGPGFVSTSSVTALPDVAILPASPFEKTLSFSLRCHTGPAGGLDLPLQRLDQGLT